jgi:hypothetical protein
LASRLERVGAERLLIGQLGEAGVATRGLTTAINIAKVALATLGIATVVTAGIALLADQVISAEKAWMGFGGGAEDAMKRVTGTINKYNLGAELAKVLDGNDFDASVQRMRSVRTTSTRCLLILPPSMRPCRRSSARVAPRMSPRNCRAFRPRSSPRAA